MGVFGGLYKGFIGLIILFAKIIQPISKKTKAFFHLRKTDSIPEGPRQIWFHCASVGEYEMILPLLPYFENTYGKHQILITFFSPSGYQYGKKRSYADNICFLPLENNRDINAFYEKYQPQIGIFVRYELWYLLLKEGIHRGIHFYLINARFHKSHFIFKPWGKPYRQILSKYSMLFTSDLESETLLKKSGLLQTIFNGDTRYDRVSDIIKKANPNGKILQFKDKTPLLILGSSYREEELLALTLLQSKPNPKLKILIAPHHINEKRIQEILETFKTYSIGRYTQQESVESLDILILDTIGMLSSAYQYGDFALVGGGYSGALHNIIEPAFWGCAVFFGPKFSKFMEATEMIEKELAEFIENEEKWIAKIHFYLNNQVKLTHQHQKTKSHCEEKTGSTSVIITYFKKNILN